MSAFERLVDKLRDDGRLVREIGSSKAVAQCPAHDDHNPSLSLTATETKVLVHCHAQCDVLDVLDALGMTAVDLFNEPRTRYDYADRYGSVLRSVARTYDSAGTKKTFRPAGGDVKAAILYRLPKVTKAVEAGATVYLVEGEEDVHALEAAGLVATTGPQGANSIGKVDFTPLKGAHVVAVVDKDEAGKKWAGIVDEKLREIVTSLSFVEAKTGKDAADHIAAGHGVEDLVELEDETATVERELLATLKTGDWLDGQTFPPLAWAVHGLLPEGFGLFTGPPKAGKSWAALGIGLAVASGTPALGAVETGDPRPVLLLALEDGDRRLQGRCRALLDDGQAIPPRLDYQTSTSPQLVTPLIRAWLRRHGHERPLVILDTLGKVMPPALPGEGAYQRDYRIGSQLKRLVDEHSGACLLVVHHTRKAEAADWMDGTSGTNGLNGAADWTANLSRPRNEDRGILRVTGRDVPEGEYAIRSDAGRWTIEGQALAEAAKIAAQAKITSGVGDRSAEIVAFVTERGTVKPKDVEEALDLPDARRYLSRLADAGRLTKPSRGTYAPCPPVPSVPMSHSEEEDDHEGEWDNGTHGTHVEDADDRPKCPACTKRMGKQEADAGLCMWCQRTSVANDAARRSA